MQKFKQEFKTKQQTKQIIANIELDLIEEMDKCWKKAKIASRSEYIRQCIQIGNDKINKKL